MKWVTRERPKIDRIACPWLIARSSTRSQSSSTCRAIRCWRSPRIDGVPLPGGW